MLPCLSLSRARVLECRRLRFDLNGRRRVEVRLEVIGQSQSRVTLGTEGGGQSEGPRRVSYRRRYKPVVVYRILTSLLSFSGTRDFITTVEGHREFCRLALRLPRASFVPTNLRDGSQTPLVWSREGSFLQSGTVFGSKGGETGSGILFCPVH